MTRSKPQTPPPKYFGPSPVEKIQFLANVASLKKLSRADFAVLITLTNMISSKTGVAWPSFKTIACRSSCSDRHAKTSVKKLVELGLLRIVSHGNKICSNRYALNQSSQHLNTIESSELESTTVVNSSEQTSDVQTSLDVLCRSPQPIHESVHKARDEMNGSSEGVASPTGASGPSGSPQPGKDRYPEFWDIYPLRAGVAEAEQLLSELITEGYDYSDILEGAQRYAKYTEATGNFRRSTAPEWLKAERWRDSWSAPSKQEKTTKREKASSISEKAILNLSEEELCKLETELEDQLKRHEDLCAQCDDAAEHTSEKLNAEMQCPVGLQIYKSYKLVCDRLTLLEKDQNDFKP